MIFDILTIFPTMVEGYFQAGLLKRAQEAGQFQVRVHDLRQYAQGKHRVTDDYPYGGGQGMVLKAEPVAAALEALTTERTWVALMTPQGVLFSQQLAWELAKKEHIIIICGRYEGVDERVAESLVDTEISVGDYILTGGELPALVVVDAVARLLPGVVGDEASVREDTLEGGLLKYPQYTRPRLFRGLPVPEILLSGDHGRIARWRRKEALKRTLMRRPDLLRHALLNPEDEALLEEIRSELEGKVG